MTTFIKVDFGTFWADMKTEDKTTTWLQEYDMGLNCQPERI